MTRRYRCEVSEEGPMFATDSKYGDLLVVVTPHNGPRIDGAQNRLYHTIPYNAVSLSLLHSHTCFTYEANMRHI